MKFSVDRDNLFKVLQKINSIIEEKASLSILSNFLLKARHGGLELHANNMEIGFRDEIEAQVEQEGNITLPARKIFDIIREIPSKQEIRFFMEDKGKVLIKAERATFRVPYLPIDTYPTMPEFSEETKLSIPTYHLLELLGKTFYAVHPDETKRTLNGVLFTLGNGFLQTVATDGHRLALVKKESAYEFPEEKSFIIPRKGVSEMRRLLSEYTEDVELNFLYNMVILRKDKHLFFSRLLEGEFPQFQGAITAPYDKALTIEREALLHALRRVSLMSNELNRLVSVNIVSDSVTINSIEADFGEATEVVSASYSNGSITLGFNARYLIEALSNIDDPEVVIRLIDPEKPTQVKSSKSDDFINIVMPMRL